MVGDRTALIVTVVLAFSVLSAGCVGPLSGGDSTPDDGSVATPTQDADDASDGQQADGSDDESPASEGTDGSQPETLRLSAVETMGDVDTAVFTMEMTMEMSDRTIELDSEGVMDLASEKMRMDVNVSGMMGEQSVTQYVIGETMYTEMMGEWQVQEAPQENFWEGNELNQQRELLENASIEITDTREFDGHSVKVVTVDPDQETVEKIMAEGGTGSTAGSDFGPASQPSVSDMEVTQYIDADTNHVRYTELTAVMEVMDQEVTMTMTMTFDEFDEPVEITLPEAAEDASSAGSNPA